MIEQLKIDKGGSTMHNMVKKFGEITFD
ncbi:MAG: hypothetical protein K0Q99_2265, partial [Clostridia bacterium]|nr:hypothetical protein [Clostridia bacterium]